ncbi:MAG TPA: DUF2079 domain-containing protein [Ktedonobacterales bacterium]
MISPQVQPSPRQSALVRAWDWITRFEARSAPFNSGAASHIAFDITFALALIYATILSLFTVGRQDTFLTHAEDLGIMDQALWNTIHGHFMLQTICNPITDVNCLGGVSRFAIHFEPVLIPLSLLYLIWPSVKALLVLQAVVVASGALPVWLLSTRRLGNPWWGVGLATLFLVYPPMLSAVTDDFHPETLAATALVWAFYFLTTRRYRALVVTLALALLCKETLTLDVIGIGLFVAVFHRRWRLGLGIIAGAALTLALALVLMRALSPLGHSPVTSRYGNLLHAPVSTLISMSHDPARRGYLVKLLAPFGFLPLLSPWLAAIALPSTLLNLFSSDPLMYSGGYQYNTDIAAVGIAATIDALAWLAPLVSRWLSLARARLRARGAPPWIGGATRPGLLVALALILIAVAGFGSQATRIYQQVTVRHIWPSVTAHDQLGESIAAAIPQSASVSAQSTLTPHVSQRYNAFQFPSGANTADYVFLDVTSGDFYPFKSPTSYVQAVRAVLESGNVAILTAQDGYLLLRRAPGAGPVSLPGSFYTFASAPTAPDSTNVDVRFQGGLEFVGYRVDPPRVSVTEPSLTVTTYWRVTGPLESPQTIVVTLTPPGGRGRIVLDDSLTQEWLPPQQWEPGQTILIETWPINLDPSITGAYVLGIEVRNGAPPEHPPVSQNVPCEVLTPPGAGGLPAVTAGGRGAALTTILVQ